MPRTRTLLSPPQLLVKLNGATSTTRTGALRVFITHPGTSTILDIRGNMRTYTHLDRRTVSEYTIRTDRVSSQVHLLLRQQGALPQLARGIAVGRWTHVSTVSSCEVLVS